MAQGEKMLSAAYDHIVVKMPNQRYEKRIFYPETGVMTHATSYGDRELEYRHGPHREWYDNGQRWVEGSFANGRPSGLWTYYDFPDGEKMQEGRYADGLKEGQWTDFDWEGLPVRIQRYHKGKLHGETQVFDKEGNVAATLVYEKGNLKSEVYFETGHAVRKVAQADIPPTMKSCKLADPKAQQECSNKAYLNVIYRDLKYPRFAALNEVYGNTWFYVMVNKDGTVREITTLRGLCAPVEEECRRALSKLDTWNPAYRDGEPVNASMRVSIRFNLE